MAAIGDNDDPPEANTYAALLWGLSGVSGQRGEPQTIIEHRGKSYSIDKPLWDAMMACIDDDPVYAERILRLESDT